MAEISYTSEQNVMKVLANPEVFFDNKDIIISTFKNLQDDPTKGIRISDL